MQVTQFRLRRLPIVIVTMGRACVIVMLLRRERVAEVPDRVRQRAVLRDQQQKRAEEVQR